MGFVELVAVGIGFGLVALAVVVRALRYDLDRDARSWASAYGVRLTAANSDSSAPTSGPGGASGSCAPSPGSCSRPSSSTPSTPTRAPAPRSAD